METEPGRERERGWKPEDGSGDGNERSSGDGNGNEGRIGDGKGNENREGRGGGGELWYPPHRERSRVQHQALLFSTRHHLCRQEVAPASSQQLRALEPVPACRWSTGGRTGHQGWERGYGDGNRDGGGDGREYEHGDEHEGRDGSRNGSGNGRENGDESRDEGGGEREPGNLRSGNRGWLKDARRRATRSSNQQPKPQDPPPSETVTSC